MKSRELIALSASTMALTALGIDIMLPVLAEMRVHFGLDPESTAASQIIVFFFMGQVAQIVFGILSDRLGRLAILRIGFPLYIIGGVAAAFSPTLALMCAARFVAGVGASAVMMTTIAGIRDRFVGDQMARIMSLIFTIFLFTPIIAPFLGVAILQIASWQAVFLTPPIFAVIIFLWSSRLDESLPKERRIALTFGTIKHSIKSIVTNRIFLRYTTVTTILFSVLSSYVSSSEHIIGIIYGKPKLFTWIFAGMGLIMSFCSLSNSYFARRFGAKRTLRTLVVFYLLIAIALLIVTLITGDPPAMFIFFAAVTFLMGINIAVEPNSSSLALEPMGNMAGMASAVYGTFFFFFGSALGAVISYLMVHGVLPIVIAYVLVGILIVTLIYTAKKEK